MYVIRFSTSVLRNKILIFFHKLSYKYFINCSVSTFFNHPKRMVKRYSWQHFKNDLSSIHIQYAAMRPCHRGLVVHVDGWRHMQSRPCLAFLLYACLIWVVHQRQMNNLDRVVTQLDDCEAKRRKNQSQEVLLKRINMMIWTHNMPYIIYCDCIYKYLCVYLYIL